MRSGSSEVGAFQNVVELVRRRAAEHGERPLFSLLDERGEVSAVLTYAGLDRRARAIAAGLAGSARPGDRALLLYPFGLDFIAAFTGALYAGVAAVPAYPPRSNRSSGRLLSIVQDARPRVALTLSSSLPEEKAGGFGLDRVKVVATDRIEDDCEEDWRPPALGTGSLAFLQYTSGSTSLPKGVAVSHGNLLHNEEMIRQGFGMSEESVVAGWLPLYHDMGLIGNVLQPLYAGASCYLFPSLSFLQDPGRWLRAISRYRATVSGGPNFAYELCVRRIGEDKARELDLSSWRVAFSGAEPVRAATLERFTARFAPAGFRREAFYPCYGLAEATLFVSGGGVEAPPVVEELNAGGERPVPLVGCGTGGWLGQSVRVVDPETCAEREPGQTGEIWVQGPAVAGGYWGRPEETLETFAAVLASGEGPFLRTGDLGLLSGGELFVTGRLKDLIILRGRNHYPHDIEATAEASSAVLRPGCSAAFAVEAGGEERLVLVCEADRKTKQEDLKAAAMAVHAAVAEEHEVQLHDLVLTGPGGVLKTSSGKVQRYACRAAYLGGVLPVLLDRGVGTPAPASGAVLDRETLLAMGREQRRRGILAHLRSLLAALNLPAASVLDPEHSLISLGLDSLAAVELKMRLEESLGVSLPLASLLGEVRLGDLVEQVREAMEQGGAGRRPAAAGDVEEMALSHGQRALWFVERLAPEAGAYNLAGAAQVFAELDLAALRRALGRLARRHPSLRTTFHEAGGEPFQRVSADLEPAFLAEDASGWDGGALQERLAAEACRPFHLESGPLLRMLVCSRSPAEHIVLLAVHHLAVDFWSLALLVEELGALYGEEAGGARADLAPLPATHADFVRRESELLESGEGERLWAFWRDRLTGEIPTLELPWDRPRPLVQTYRGAVRHLVSGPGLREGVRGLAAACSATPFAVLLAAFQALLYRYTGQEDLLIGIPAAGRDTADLRSVAGYFVNPLPLRANVQALAPFGELAGQAQRALSEALAHQAFPFFLMAQRLHPVRDPGRSPLFQVTLSLQSSRPGGSDGLAALALGLDGVPLAAGPLTLHSLGVKERRVPLDLTLNAAEIGDGLAIAAEFNVDLFDPATADRLLRHLRNLLTSAVADPRSPVSGMEILDPAEKAELLAAGTGPASCAGGDVRVHHLFAAQARRTPETSALISGGLRWTYGELAQRVATLAERLRSLGVGPELRVGIAVHRSPALVVAVLATLEAGGAYVPVDPAYPLERSAAILEDAGIAVLLAHSEPAARFAGVASSLGAAVLELDELGAETGPERCWPAAEAWSGPGFNSGPDQLAYILFTSGSTGRPKGVQVSHRSLASFLLSMQRRPGFGPDDILLAITTVAFDIAALELLLPLISGGAVALADRESAADPRRLLAALRETGATVLQATPATWRMLVEGGWDGRPRLRALCGGEALPADLAAALRPRAAALWNLYGPTETTVWSMVAELDEVGAEVPLGGPIDGTTVVLVDRSGNLVPPGVPGELLIGGEGVARGYEGRPDLTAERFVPDPFGGRPGARLYRTGDLVRRRVSGTFEFLGRFDHQVKIRGFRIELGEIEAALRRHSAVREAVVVALRGPGSAGPRLVAYLVAEPGSAPAAAELRAFLLASLPDYMVPNVFVPLEEIPRTPNGKIDRRALPVPAVPEAGEGRSAVEDDPVTELVAQIFAAALDRERVGPDDDFFELGGHSLLVTRVVSRMRSVFGRELPVAEVFKHPTPARLAAVFAGRGEATCLPQVRAGERESEPALSFPQQRLWFLDRLEPGNAVYNMPYAVRLRGPLSPEALESSLRRVVARHEVLRTTFADRGGTPVQVVAPHLDLSLPCIDLRSFPEAEREREMARLVDAEVRRTFDLEAGPLLRMLLLRLADDDHAIVLVMHHIISDGWSMGVLLRELQASYDAWAEGREADLPPLAVQYTDFSDWQRRHLPLAEDLAYWRETLAGMPVLELPFDRPRPPVETYAGASRPVRLPARLAAGLHALTRSQGATLFMTLLAAFEALMHRHSGQSDFGVGTPIANRFQPELESLIGFFANTLVLRADLRDSPSFESLLARTRDAALAAYAHQNLPFEKLVEELQPERTMSHNPLFQVMFVLQNAPLPPLQLAGLTLAPLPLDTGTAKFDLTLFLWEEGGGLAGTLEHSTDLFDTVSLQRLWRHFEVMLESAVADPGQPVGRHDLLLPEERHQLTVEWSDTALVDGEPLCVHQWVEAQCAATPDAIALESGDLRMTYRELNARANGFAHRLMRLGVGPETLVGICVERSWEMVVALLAVLKAGGAAVALDPAYPRERLSYIVRDARLTVLLAQGELAAGLEGLGAPLLLIDRLAEPAASDPGNPVTGVTLDNPIYAIYTSGSTGQPKGILVTHRAFANLLTWQLRHSALAHCARTAQFATFGFCVSFQEIFTSWCSGGTLVLVEEALRRDLAALASFVDEREIERLHLPFAALKNLTEAFQESSRAPWRLREVITAGEQLQVGSLVRRFFSRLPGCTLHNQYGASETHVITAFTLSGPVEDWPDLPPVGRAVANTRIHLLDSELQPVPVGVPGEVCAGGDCVPRGYLRDPAMTARKLIPDPLGAEPGARLYRTGDLARRLPSGDVVYLGRIDSQVKIRGYRVELGEIDSVLRQHPGVRDAAVVAQRGSGAEGARLVAYVISARDRVPETAELRAFLKARLPEFMVPAYYVPLERLPLNANGKLDHERLPAPEPGRPDLEQEFVAPRTPVEERIATIWSGTLGLERIGMRDNFFDLGGHSLLATQVISRVQETFGVRLPLRRLFDSPTVESLAVAVDEAFVERLAQLSDAEAEELLRRVLQ